VDRLRNLPRPSFRILVLIGRRQIALYSFRELSITRSHYVEPFARKRTVKGRNPSCISSIRIIERLGINSIMRRPIAHWTLAKLTSSNVATYRDEHLKTDAPATIVNELSSITGIEMAIMGSPQPR